MGNNKVAVVTGANKGIGYEIVKGLCESYGGKVYLTSRDETRGKEAVEKLKQQGLSPIFYQLDLNDEKTITKFRDHIKATEGGIDVLINNAGIAFKNNATEPFSEQAKVTVQVNYFNTLSVCNILFPILRANARVINVSSSLGHLSKIPSAELRSKFSSPSLTVDELSGLMKQFVLAAKEGKQGEQGWGNSAYAVSKVGLSALTIVHQRQLDSEPENRNISANSLHPGYVQTDMSSNKGIFTPARGATAALFLALKTHDFRGKYIWHDGTLADWFAAAPPAPI